MKRIIVKITVKNVVDDCEADVSNVLLLLLGCAVQGEQRGKFIERIKRMEEELQTALLNQIKKVIKFLLNSANCYKYHNKKVDQLLKKLYTHTHET